MGLIETLKSFSESVLIYKIDFENRKMAYFEGSCPSEYGPKRSLILFWVPVLEIFYPELL